MHLARHKVIALNLIKARKHTVQCTYKGGARNSTHFAWRTNKGGPQQQPRISDDCGVPAMYGTKKTRANTHVLLNELQNMRMFVMLLCFAFRRRLQLELEDAAHTTKRFRWPTRLAALGRGGTLLRRRRGFNPRRGPGGAGGLRVPCGCAHCSQGSGSSGAGSGAGPSPSVSTTSASAKLSSLIPLATQAQALYSRMTPLGAEATRCQVFQISSPP